MGEASAIKWTDNTFNPWWGCARVSPGCQHCYAETFAKRTGHDVWGKDGERRMFGEKHWNEPLQWNAKAEQAGRPTLVFCASMADVFEDRRDLDEPRARLFELIDRTPWLRWQLLTKRPERVAELVPARWLALEGGWPSNAWIGTTVEDQQRAEERIPHLLNLPAPVRFLSCEPLVGPVDITKWLWPHYWPLISWVIVGGESGPGHRPLVAEHAQRLCAQVLAGAVPLFFKQWGGRTPDAGGDLIDPHYPHGTPARYHQFPKEAGR